MVLRPVLTVLRSELALTTTQEEEEAALQTAVPVHVEKKRGAMRVYWGFTSWYKNPDRLRDGSQEGFVVSSFIR
jgi:hypothetical protein